MKAENAGRGVLYIALAKLYFMIAGYAIYFVLPRLLPTKAAWGDYLLVIGLVSVIDNVIVTGTIQSVSRFTAQGDVSDDAVKKSALLVQLLIGGGIAVAYFLAAPLIAQLERDDSLVNLYRLSAGIIFCYSFYAVFVGSLNGLRFFGKQAALDAGFATLRAISILGFAALGYSVMGAIGGFVSAALLILFISSFWVGFPRKSDDSIPEKTIADYMGRLFLYTLTLNLMIRVDLFLLKRNASLIVDMDNAALAAKAGSELAAFYGTAQSLAFIPYQAILAVAFVIFPLVSRSTFEEDIETTRTYIRQTLRLSLVFVSAVASVLIANPSTLITIPYPTDYQLAGPALRILALGMVAFSMFTIINTILNGAGKTMPTILSGAVGLGVSFAANSLIVPMASSSTHALELAAYCSAGAMFIALVLATFLLWKQFKAAFPIMTLFRVLIALIIVVAIGHFTPNMGKLMTMLESIGLFILFMGLLVVFREFNAEDRAKFLRVFIKR